MGAAEELVGGGSAERSKRKGVAGAVPRSVVRAVSQVAVDLHGEKAFETARREVLRWMRRRVGRGLPREAWGGQGFTMDHVGALPAEAVAVETAGLRLWAGRLDDADKQVPQRVWTTEVALGEGSGVTKLGVRLLCVSHGEDPLFQRTVPGLVRQVVESVNVRLSGLRVGLEPTFVEDEEDVGALVELLRSVHREVDVVVFSIPEGPGDTEAIWQLARAVARSVLCAAHVVVAGPAASYELSDRVGREFSVFGGAVRTYRCNFEPEEDDPYRHPLALAETVNELDGEDDRSFRGLLVDQALRRSILRHGAEQGVPSYRFIHRFADEEQRKVAREAAKDDSELLEVAMTEIADLKEQMESGDREWEGLLGDLESAKDGAEEENGRLKSQNAYLRERVATLERQRLTGVGDEDDGVPASLAQVYQSEAVFSPETVVWGGFDAVTP